MTSKPPPPIKKTVPLTYKQAGFSAGAIATAAALLTTPLSGYFQTKEEAKPLEIKLAVIEAAQKDIKKTIDDNDKEAVRRQERSNDKIMIRIDQMETRMANTQDKTDRRVDTLEASLLSSKKRAY